MSMKVPYTCDTCGADISTGDGRIYLLQVGAVRIALKPGTTLSATGGDIPSGQLHFCDYNCLLAWTTKAVAVEATKVSAAAEVAKAEAQPVKPS